MSDHPEKGGLGYPPWFRERALRFLDGAAGETKDERVQAAAETFSVSASSIYAWAARKRDEGTVETIAHAGGVPRSLSGVGDVLLLLYMVAYPNVTKAKYAYWVGGALGQPVSERMIGDALNRMRVTRKHIHKTAVEQDPLRNVLFETCAPPWGFKGVSLPRLVDVDESFALLCEADRTTGYAFIGQRAEIVSTYTKGTRYNIMLAVGYTGLVNYWIHRENCTGEVYTEFLRDYVFPKLERPSFVLNDNLEVHFTAPVMEVFAASPHQPLQRPPNNPEKAPVEFFFHLLKDKIKEYRQQLTNANFPQFIAKAIESLPWEDAPAVFRHCGYRAS